MTLRPVLRNEVVPNRVAPPKLKKTQPVGKTRKPILRAPTVTHPIKVRFSRARRQRVEVQAFFANRPGYPGIGFQPEIGFVYWVVGTLHKHRACYWLQEVEAPQPATQLASTESLELVEVGLPASPDSEPLLTR